MSTQPEAMLLIEQLRGLSTMFKAPSHEKGVCNGAIQELRRLHAVEAQRDALLEALREYVYLHDNDCVCSACAAIAKAEGQA